MLIRRLDGTTGDRAKGRRTESIERYAAVDGHATLEIVHDDGGSKEPGNHARVLFSSGRFARAGGEWLFHVGLWTPVEFRDEFLAWYSIEHLPILLECPSWDGCRFVEQPVEDGCQFYALHQLADRSALQSEQRTVSRSTAWFGRLKSHDWFDEAFVRTLYRRVA